MFEFMLLLVTALLISAQGTLVSTYLSTRRAIDLSRADSGERRRENREKSFLRFDEVNWKPVISMVYPSICGGAGKIHRIIKGIQSRFHASNRVNRDLVRFGIC